MLHGMEYPFGQSLFYPLPTPCASSAPSSVEYNEKLKNLALYSTTQQQLETLLSYQQYFSPQDIAQHRIRVWRIELHPSWNQDVTRINAFFLIFLI